jgi:hypothetical protein
MQDIWCGGARPLVEWVGWRVIVEISNQCEERRLGRRRRRRRFVGGVKKKGRKGGKRCDVARITRFGSHHQACSGAEIELSIEC